MKQSIRDKLEQLSSRMEELDRALSAEDAAWDMEAFRRISQERAEVQPVVDLYRGYLQTEADACTAEEMLRDPELRELGEGELEASRTRLAELDSALQLALLPRDPNDRSEEHT